jgi:hypothetical protein
MDRASSDCGHWSWATGGTGRHKIPGKLLFGVTPVDTTVFLRVPVFLTIVATPANLIPVPRGSRVDPITIFKYE